MMPATDMESATLPTLLSNMRLSTNCAQHSVISIQKSASLPDPSVVKEQKGIAEMRAQLTEHQNSTNTDFDLLRWLRAYEGSVGESLAKLRRHERVRAILGLDAGLVESVGGAEGTEGDGWRVDSAAELYAPCHVLGEVGAGGDHRIMLLEQSGRFDLLRMMREIRITSFMLNRFCLMERILREIRASEARHGHFCSAVLVMDLANLSFHPSLVGFLSGPYRIMWGTLIEQYPYLISTIVVINAPAYMNVLWQACAAFIPAEYKKKIHLLGTNWQERIDDYLPIEALPQCYPGGKRAVEIREPVSCCIPEPHPFALTLNIDSHEHVTHVSVPAGGWSVHSYYLEEGHGIEFYMRNEKDCTFNIYYSPHHRSLPNPGDATMLADSFDEAYAGCERPGMPTLDFWRWLVPQTGFYHVVFGNEKAWLMSVQLRFQLYELHEASGARVKVQPLQ